MTRRWVLLSIAYLSGGFIGTVLVHGGFHAIHNGCVVIGGDPLSFAPQALLWPVWVVAVILYPDQWIVAVRFWLSYLGSFAISYVLLSRFALKPKAKGFCPACGYDLRATPERCPECGTVVKQ